MKINLIFIFLLLLSICFSCNRTYTPKPSGYLRINFPEKEYQRFDNSYPYSFDLPVYAEATEDIDYNTEPYWININFPQFNGKIHISYKPVIDNIYRYAEDSRTFVYKHAIKADAIEEQFYENKEKEVYSILYDIKGNAASSIQFVVTDSTEHFLRGALYFNTRPNKDSLAPVITFIREDIVRMIESFEWKDID